MTTVNIYEMAQTWNNGAVAFTAIGMNVTDTASDAASLLMDLQVGGVSKFKVDKDGAPYFGHATKRVEITSPYDFRVTTGSSFDFVIGTTAKMTMTSFGLGLDVLGFGRATAYPTRLTFDGAGVLAQRNGTNAQTFNLYNTYTDASNYERGFMKWNSNVLEIGTEAAGTGAARNTAFYHGATKIFEVTSNALNIASSSQLLTFGNGANIFGGTSLLYTTTSTGVHRLRTSSGTDTFKVGPGYVELAEPETVATLPGSPVVGMMARVTDASAPAVGSTVTGGGAANALCWYNGTNWTVIGV